MPKKPGRKKATDQPEVLESSAEIVPIKQEGEPPAFVTGSAQAGVFALGSMTDADFEARLQLMDRAESRIRTIFERALTKGDTEEFDLMAMKGIPKPFITQNGSNRIKQILGLVAVPGELSFTGNGVDEPIRAQVLVRIHIGDESGPCMGGAWGVASSWEPKWRYRNAQLQCPECGNRAVIKGKAEYGGGYLCWVKKEGCGAKFADTDTRITEQPIGKVEHEDPEETIETLARMAEKRADVAATRRFSGISRWTNLDPDAPGFRDKIEQPKPTEAPPKREPAPMTDAEKAEILNREAAEAQAGWSPPGKVKGQFESWLFSPEHANPRDWWRAVQKILQEMRKRGASPKIPNHVASWALNALNEE
jgi:hypothetical protein